MKLKCLVLCIFFTLSHYNAKAFSLDDSIPTLDTHGYKIIKDHLSFISKQDGDNTCWANVLETIYNYQGELIKEKDLFISGMAFYKGILVSESEYPDFINNTNARMPKLLFMNMLYGRASPISISDIEKNIDNDYAIVYGTDSHTSFIVGYSKENFIIVNSYVGKFEKVPKKSITNHIYIADPIPPIFYTVNRVVANTPKLVKYP